jgi:hypothetical protein
MKLPVSSWTAAEAANLFFNCLNHIRLFRDIPELKAQVRSLCKRQFLPTFYRCQFKGCIRSMEDGNAGGGAVRQTPNQGVKRRMTLAGPCPSCRLRKGRASVMPATRLLRFNRKLVAPCRRPVTRPVTTERILVSVSSLARARSSHRANRNRRNPAPAAIAA